MNFLNSSLNSITEYISDTLDAPIPAKIDMLIRERQSLLVALKMCSSKMVKSVSDHEKATGSLSGYVFDETNFTISALCSSVERVLFHGLKITEFYGTFPFWGLLQRMNSVYPPLMEFTESTSQVAQFSSTLRSTLALSRGWVRYAINTRALSACLSAMVQQPRLSFFYYEGSIVLDSDCLSILISILKLLEDYNFNLLVDQEELNVVPSWLLTSFAESEKAKKHYKLTTGRRASAPEAKGPAAAVKSNPNAAPALSSGGWDSVYAIGGTPSDDKIGTATYQPSKSRKSPKDIFSNRVKLFGTSLRELVMDDKRCKYAVLDSHVGLPRQVQNMISVIHRHVDLPGLFRCRGSREELMVLRDALEAEQDIPAGTMIYTVAHCLLQWLYELPEPLLCFEHFQSFLMVNTIESIPDRMRNFQLLVDEVDWWQRPVLIQIMNLFSTALLPVHASKNGLTLSAVTVMTTPFLLRDPKFGAIAPHPNQVVNASSLADIDAACMVTCVVAGPCIEFLFQNQEIILKDVRASYEQHVAWLEDKLERVEFVQRHAAMRKLLVGEVRSYLITRETGGLPEAFLASIKFSQSRQLPRGDGATITPSPPLESLIVNRFRIDSIGLRVSVIPELEIESLNANADDIADSLTIIVALWNQLEGAHREMLQNHWAVYIATPKDSTTFVSRTSSNMLAPQTEASDEEDAFTRSGSESRRSSEDTSDSVIEMNRVSIAKKQKVRKINDADSEDESLGIDGDYDHVRNEIGGLVRLSYSASNLEELGVAVEASDAESIEDDSVLYPDDVNPAGQYDGEDAGQASFHEVIPAVILQSERQRKRLGSESSEETAYSDPDVVVVGKTKKGKKPDVIVEHFEEGVDDGWGERGREHSGLSILQMNKQSFFSASARDATRFEAYMHEEEKDIPDKDRVDKAAEWKAVKSTNAPIVFPVYDVTKVLEKGSVESYRWSICGLSGCALERDVSSKPSRNSRAMTVVAKAEVSSEVPLPPHSQTSPMQSRKLGVSDGFVNNKKTRNTSSSLLDSRREEHDQPLQLFETHEFGSIAAELLLHFLQRFGQRADLMVCEFARKRIKYCSLSMVTCRLAQIVLWVLRLVPSSKPSHHSYGLRSSTSNNNVSELSSFLKEQYSAYGVPASPKFSPVAAPKLARTPSNRSEKSGEYENKIFECSNTYNISDSELQDAGVDISGDEHTPPLPAEDIDIEKDVLMEDRYDIEDDLIESSPINLDDDLDDTGVADSKIEIDVATTVAEPNRFPSNEPIRKVEFENKPHKERSGTHGRAIQILPPRMLAQEPSWALLSSEKCIQEVFDVALLMFDDIWKYAESTEACGIHYDSVESPNYHNSSAALKALLPHVPDDSCLLHFDPFHFCLDVVKTLMSELIDMKLRSVHELWNQWTLLRMRRQELVFESKLLLKLSRLNLLRQSIEETSTDSKAGGSKRFSVLASLSSLLAPATLLTGKTSDAAMPLNPPLSTTAVAPAAHELYKSKHDHYMEMNRQQERPGTPPLKIYGDSQILTLRQLKELRHKLPEQYKFSDWHLKYRMSSDGADLMTMIKLSPDCQTMLLVLLNSVGDVFGALITEPWRKKLGNSFYGSGTNHVWTFLQGEDLQIYSGTGANEYYILVSERYFAMGSGGNFAIYLDPELRGGCSGPCETYASPSLCSSEEFTCVACELYSLESNL